MKKNYRENFIERCRKASVPILDELPEGWKFNEQATTAPDGYKWATNGQPFYRESKSGDYETNPLYRSAVVKIVTIVK